MLDRRVLRQAATAVAAASLFAALPASDPAGALAPKIAFSTNRDTQREIYVMEIDGSSPVNLTNHIGADVDPAWSPDGATIAFASNRDGDYEIFSMNADGSGVTQLTSNTVDDRRPEWSPDGGTIAFDRAEGIESNIWTMTAAGGAAVQLTGTTDSELDPAYSPDGTRITYTRANPYQLGPDVVYLMRADGAMQIPLSSMHRNPDHARHATWSPDGTSIALARGGGWPPGSEPRGWHLAVMDADGSHARRAGDGPDDPWPWTVDDISWSGDSTRLVFGGSGLDEPGSEEIYAAAPDGTGLVKLTDNTYVNGAYDGQPDVQPLDAPAYAAPRAVADRIIVGSSVTANQFSTTVFPAHVRHRVTVTGEFHWARTTNGVSSDSLLADAECSTQGAQYLPNQFIALKPTGDILDLHVSDIPIPWKAAQADSLGCATDDDHTYTWEFVSGTGGRLRLKVADSNQIASLDNEGYLMVEVEAI